MPGMATAKSDSLGNDVDDASKRTRSHYDEEQAAHS